jgi:hypothetical protein
MKMNYKEQLNKFTEGIIIPAAQVQDKDVINKLRNFSNYYHASNTKYDNGALIPIDSYVTYSKGYAQSLKHQYLYEVSKPISFVHTKVVGNSQLLECPFHIIIKEPIKIIKQVN